MEISESRVVKFNAGQSTFLDMLRYVAALMVVFAHIISHFYPNVYVFCSKAYHLNLGGLGVGLFFILSGFLISYTVHRKSSGDAGYGLEEYFIERFVRIYIVFAPVLFFALAARVIGTIAGFDQAVHPMGGEFVVNTYSVKHFLSTLFMLQGVKGITAPGETFSLVDTAWTLNYEFMYYIAYGAVCLRMTRLKSVRFARLLMLIAALFILSRLDNVLFLSSLWVAGAFISFLYSRGLIPRSSRLLAIVIFASVSLYVMLLRFYGLELSRWVTITFMSVLFYLVLGLCGRANPSRWVADLSYKLASYSYSMYLIHYAIIYVSYTLLTKAQILSGYPSDSVGRFIIVAVLTLVVNVVSLIFSLFTEKHTGSVRRYLKKVIIGI